MEKTWSRNEEITLANFIQAGVDSGKIKENHNAYLVPRMYRADGLCEGCAMGHGLVGLIGNPDEAYKQLHAQFMEYNHHEFNKAFASLLGISEDLVARVSNLHMIGYTIKDIVSDLRVGCFS